MIQELQAENGPMMKKHGVNQEKVIYSSQKEYLDLNSVSIYSIVWPLKFS